MDFSLQRIDEYFDEYIFGYMFQDISGAIDIKANYLAALGLSVYTEVMGGLVTGNLKSHEDSGANYRAFLPYLGLHYVELEEKIRIWKRVRCGLIHEYFVKEPSLIALKFKEENLPGIYYLENINTVIVAVEHYFKDFKSGVKKYYEELKNGDSDLIAKFEQATNAPSGAIYIHEAVKVSTKFSFDHISVGRLTWKRDDPPPGKSANSSNR